MNARHTIGVSALSLVFGFAACAQETPNPEVDPKPAPAAPSKASPAKAPMEGNKHVNARLICKTNEAEAGGAITLGIMFEIAPKWHIYSRCLNDSGAPIILRGIKLPDGWKAGELRWPAPTRYRIGGEGANSLDHVYEREVTLLMDVQVPANAKIGSSVTITGDVEMLVCDSNECVPAESSLSLTLPVVAKGKASEGSLIAPWINAESRLAKPWPPDATMLGASWSGDTLTITCPRADRLAFMPDADSAWPADIIACESKGDTLKISFKRQAGVSAAQRLRALGYVETYFSNRIDNRDPKSRANEAEERSGRRRPAHHFYWLDLKQPEKDAADIAPKAKPDTMDKPASKP